MTGKKTSIQISVETRDALRTWAVKNYGNIPYDAAIRILLRKVEKEK